jgi:hypothetical protein
MSLVYEQDIVESRLLMCVAVRCESMIHRMDPGSDSARTTPQVAALDNVDANALACTLASLT